MITSKKELYHYLKEDKVANKIKKRFPSIIGDDLWKFLISLRVYEFYSNCHPTSCLKYLWKYLYRKFSYKLGFTIPINVIEEGLKINHYGLIVINSKARIGKYCELNQGINIGNTLDRDAVPILGNNIFIGPGAKIFGRIVIADNIKIGANAVVNKSFYNAGATLVGVPAIEK